MSAVAQRPDRFPLADSLRGIGALMVIAAHAAPLAGGLEPDAVVRPYIARLEVATSVFFILSAFLLYRPFVRARLRGEPVPSVGAYGWRRVLRIAPAYWVALTVIAYVFVLDPVFSLSGIPIYYGVLEIYSEDWIGGGIPQAWTLGVEVAFYALLPLYALALRRLPGRTFRGRLRGEVWAVAVLIGASLVYTAVLSFGGIVDPITYEPPPLLSLLPGYLDQLGVGLGLAVLSVWLEGRERAPAFVRVLDRLPGLAWVAAALGFWFLSTQLGLSNQPTQDYTSTQWLVRHVLNAAIALLFVWPALFGNFAPRGLVRRILANPVLLWLGLISYGIYLYHYHALFALLLFGWGDFTIVHPYVHWFVGGLGLTVILAAVSWYVVERPLLRFKPPGRGLPHPPDPPAVPAQADPVLGDPDRSPTHAR